jgi:hypothetical protein
MKRQKDNEEKNSATNGLDINDLRKWSIRTTSTWVKIISSRRRHQAYWFAFMTSQR